MPDSNHTWDLSPLFSSDSDKRMIKKRKELESIHQVFVSKWENRNDYLQDPKVLKNALDEYKELMTRYGTDGDEGYYFWLRTQQDEINPELKARFNQIQEFSNRIKNQIQFFSIRIAKIPTAKQQEFLSSPLLKDYKHYLERLFAEAKYVLSESEEKILTLKAMPAHMNWVKMTSSFLVKEERNVLGEDGKHTTKNFSEILSLLDSRQKNVRDDAAKAFNDILKKYVEVAEAELNSILMDKKIDDELRGVQRPDLPRHLSDDIDSDVVDSVIHAISNKNDIAQKYYELKAKLFGVSKLAYHERNVEYGTIEKKYSYDESKELVLHVFKNLDPEFETIFSEFIKNNQIDVFPRKGKRSGAFCVYNLLSQPTYLLLNHTDTLNDVTTLAHELGHGINDELMRKKQHALNFGTPLSTAEVASTFMEDFVLDEIMNQADDELKLTILMMKLNSDISTIFRQISCYKFETELHASFRQTGYLSYQEIGKIFQKHMKAYMGDYVEQSDGAENWWVYWSHIRSFFYVYSYASGLLISKSLQASVKKNPKFILKVKEFLSAGMSDSPKNIFNNLGVDITNKSFWDQGLAEVESLLYETESLARKLGKLR